MAMDVQRTDTDKTADNGSSSCALLRALVGLATAPEPGSGSPPGSQADASVSQGLARLEQGLEALFQKQECLDRASAQLAQLSDRHYREHVIEPLVRHVSRLYDWIYDAAECGEAMGLLGAAQAQVAELLAVYDVHIVEAPVGVAFDPKTMQASDDSRPAAAGGRLVVSRCVRVGLCVGDRVFRPQVVEVRPDRQDELLRPDLDEVF